VSAAPAYLNGEFLPLNEAKVPVLDRGFLFADGVYEVIPIYGQAILGLDSHLARLEQSLAGLRIDNPLDRAGWTGVIYSLREQVGNPVGDFSVYLQITRGVGAKRDPGFPPPGTPPTVLATISPIAAPPARWFENGLAAITLPDTRWEHCHWKTTALLPNVLMRQQSLEAGADEAILLRDGQLSEGASSNVYAVFDGEIRTPQLGAEILSGITREIVLQLAAEHDFALRECPVSEAELRAADEIWISSSTRQVLPVTQLDGAPVGDGQPGPVWRRMYDHYQAFVRALRERGRS
jgi:D-alanine transaminase